MLSWEAYKKNSHVRYQIYIKRYDVLKISRKGLCVFGEFNNKMIINARKTEFSFTKQTYLSYSLNYVKEMKIKSHKIREMNR